MPVALADIQEIVQRSEHLQAAMRQNNFQPSGVKVFDRRFKITDVAEMVGRTPHAIRAAEDRGDLPTPELDGNNRRTGYSMREVNDMRNVMNTRPWRSRSTDSPVVLAVQNFKGGVGKSTTSCTLAQYLAMKGYRVLLVDCDSQASTTQVFGISPDVDLTQDDTLHPFFAGERDNLRYAVRDTYWDGIKLIPSNLTLYSSEYVLASRVASEGAELFFSLRKGLADLQDDFDVIIIDPPPALGMISLNVLYGANAVIVPMPPAMLDFASTIQFFTMVKEVMESIARYSDQAAALSYNFIKILVNRKKAQITDTSRASGPQDAILDLARQFYGDYMMDSVVYDSAEIEAAAALGKTVLDLDGPLSSPKTYRRALGSIKEFGDEVIGLIEATWPSRQAKQARKTASA